MNPPYKRKGWKDPKLPPEPVSRIVSLQGASDHYGVDRKTIRATVAKYPNFPRVTVGGTKNGWNLDLDAIDGWLKKHKWWRGTRDRTPSIKEAIADAKFPNSVIKIQKEIAQKDNKSVVQTQLLQLELDKKRGLLVDREEVVAMLSAKMSRFAKQLELLPNLIGKKMGLSDDTIRLFRDHLDEARRALVKDDEGYFAQMNQSGG